METQHLLSKLFSITEHIPSNLTFFIDEDDGGGMRRGESLGNGADDGRVRTRL